MGRGAYAALSYGVHTFAQFFEFKSELVLFTPHEGTVMYLNAEEHTGLAAPEHQVSDLLSDTTEAQLRRRVPNG